MDVSGGGVLLKEDRCGGGEGKGHPFFFTGINSVEKPIIFPKDTKEEAAV